MQTRSGFAFHKIFYFLIFLFTLAVSACASREEVTPTASLRPARIAVVLGAGASRGFAHIGALKVLEVKKVPINMIVGTSAGSLVGSLYAAGIDSFQLQKMAISLQKNDFIDYIVPDNGFIGGEKLANYVNKIVKGLPLEKLKLPMRVVATDIRTGEETVFASGNTGWAVRASCAVPGVFQPVQIGGRTYVDGGVVSPVAVNAARSAGADVVIAVDISGGLKGSVPQGMIDTILQAIDIMYAKIAESQLKNADVVIRPQLGHIGAGDFDRRADAILEGEKAASLAMPQIDAIIARLRQEGRLAQ